MQTEERGSEEKCIESACARIAESLQMTPGRGSVAGARRVCAWRWKQRNPLGWTLDSRIGAKGVRLFLGRRSRVPYVRPVPTVEGNVGSRRDYGTERGRQGGSQIVGTFNFCAVAHRLSSSSLAVAAGGGVALGKREFDTILTKPRTGFPSGAPASDKIGTG